MRCVSKRFIGRSLNALLFFGAVVGFSVSSFIVVLNNANIRLDKAVSPRDSLPVREYQLDRGNHGTYEDYGPRPEYEYLRELEGGEAKQRAKVDHPEVIAGESRLVLHKKPIPPSPALAVPNPVNLRNREHKSKSWQERRVGGQLSDELVPRQTMLVGVITSLSKLMTQTLAIHGTWGPRATQVVYFIGEVDHIPHLPKMDVVQLEGVDDKDAEWNLKEISAIEYFMDNWLDRVDWLVLIGDETYVAAEQLEKRLNSLDARQSIYMGRIEAGRGAGGAEGEGEKGGSMCQRDPGVVYSRALLENLRLHLPTCWPGGHEEEDNSLYKCLESLEVKCSQVQEVRCVISWCVCVKYAPSGW